MQALISCYNERNKRMPAARRGSLRVGWVQLGQINILVCITANLETQRLYLWIRLREAALPCT